MRTNSDHANVRGGWVFKAAEIGVCCTAVALILRDIRVMPSALANPCGILLGGIAAYIIPPRVGPTFKFWVGVSALVAGLLFVFEILVS